MLCICQLAAGHWQLKTWWGGFLIMISINLTMMVISINPTSIMIKITNPAKMIKINQDDDNSQRM